jgi:hypothetical protein
MVKGATIKAENYKGAWLLLSAISWYGVKETVLRSKGRRICI